VLVLRQGEVLDQGRTADVHFRSQHEDTWLLIASETAGVIGETGSGKSTPWARTALSLVSIPRSAAGPGALLHP